MPRPLIALLTDFGTRDHYVAAMKGVILGIHPDAAFVDITHDIPPQDVRAAASELEACASFFPAGTIFLVVVDPGVGSARRGIALRSGSVFGVGPDNGVLTPLLVTTQTVATVELRNAAYALPGASRTFEGRDRFAPAAAWLGRGVPLEAFGPLVDDPVRLPPAPLDAADDEIIATVVRIDRFGNVITNLDRPALDVFARRGPFTITIGTHTVDGIVATYADAAPGALCALVGSSGHLEVSVNGGNAAERIGARRGDRVHIRVAARRA